MTHLAKHFPAPGEAVTRVSFDYRVRLLLDGFEVVLATEFQLVTRNGATWITPSDPSTVPPALGLLRQILKRVSVTEGGELTLDFEGGIRVVAPPHADYEAWEVVHGDGRLALAMPRGGVTTFPASVAK